MSQPHSPWPEFDQLDLLFAREGMARGPDVWFKIHALLSARITDNIDLSKPAVLARLLGPLVCKSPLHQQRIEYVITEWLTGQTTETVTLSNSVTQSDGNSAKEKQKFNRTWQVAALVSLCALIFTVKVLIEKPVEVDQQQTPKPIIKNGSGSQPDKIVQIHDYLKPNPLPIKVAAELRQSIYWASIIGLPLLLFLLYMAKRYLPQLILRNNQDDDPCITGLEIKQPEKCPDLPFSSVKTTSELSPLTRSSWLDTQRLHVADTVIATAKNFGFFYPVYQQRSDSPEYLVLVQSLHGYDQMAEVAELFIRALQRQSKHMRIRGYRFREDLRRLHPMPGVQPKENPDISPLSLKQLAALRSDARLIVISDWAIAYQPYEHDQPQAWVGDLEKFQKRIWLSPGYDSWYWAELAKKQAKQLKIRLLPLSSNNTQDIARWLSQEHNPLAPAGLTETDDFPSILTETSESWLSWRPPHGVRLKRLLLELSTFLGAEGFLVLQALAVFPKPIWPLPYILGKQLFSAENQKQKKYRLPWRRQAPVAGASALSQEQMLINLGRLPWSRHAYMPDYLRELLLKALTLKEHRRIRQAWQDIIVNFAIKPSENQPNVIPIASTALSKMELEQFLLRQEQGNALDDAIFASILLGGKLGLLDFKLPQVFSRFLPGAKKILDFRPALKAIVLTGLSIWGLDSAWHTFGKQALIDYQQAAILEENAKWPVAMEYRTDRNNATQHLAIATQKALESVKFRVTSPSEKDLTDLTQNTIRYAPGGKAAAQRVQQSLAWLTYGGQADLIAAADLPDDLPANTIKVQLMQTYQPNSGFTDSFINAYEKPVPITDGKTVKTVPFSEPDMVLIKPGQFQMGSSENEPAHQTDESPQHLVNLNYAFEIGQTEVTVEQYAAFAQATERNLPDANNWQGKNLPVTNVSFNDALAYTRWLSQQTGKNYRLPTEAEWEYAARAGTSSAYWWGNTIGKNNAACDGCSSKWDGKQAAPVKSFKPNKFGLYDTAGNVWEWTADCYHQDYKNAPTDGSAWLEAERGDCSKRVARGGSWSVNPLGLRSALRFRYVTDVAINYLGFRIARAL